MICKKDHRHEQMFLQLPNSQGGDGRHKCAGCAYETGLAAGRERQEKVDLDLDSLSESQAGAVRHKSPHAAWALGYLNGVRESYEG
ncbi:hypothetical protein D7V77_41135 [Corallococcus sp. CA041A]|uniref:hypothetical protein n=1 Tax=Corallococcus sp. CA041A TaxID=2316727 RepID=UPI000EA2C717|nr:hypothetical protein [Corallococcus sp. CA041A]RKH12499.1 hypothetical protein D7V77_41135 [Corallococcus sp. CA041A]